LWTLVICWGECRRDFGFVILLRLVS